MKKLKRTLTTILLLSVIIIPNAFAMNIENVKDKDIDHYVNNHYT